MKLKKIIVRSRAGVEKLDLDVPYVVISVTDPQPYSEGPANIPQRCGLRGVLRLEFHDFNPVDHTRKQSWNGQTIGEAAMQVDHANQVWEFVKMRPDDVQAIVVHCEAGVSRSPSIAMALADALKLTRNVLDWGSNDVFHPDAKYGRPPNRHVYNTMMAQKPRH